MFNHNHHEPPSLSTTQPATEPTIVTQKPKQKNPPSLATLPNSPGKKSSKTTKKKNKTPTLCTFCPPPSSNSNPNPTKPGPIQPHSRRRGTSDTYNQDPLTHQIKSMNRRTTIATETQQIRPTNQPTHPPNQAHITTVPLDHNRRTIIAEPPRTNRGIGVTSERREKREIREEREERRLMGEKKKSLVNKKLFLCLPACF